MVAPLKPARPFLADAVFTVGLEHLINRRMQEIAAEEPAARRTHSRVDRAAICCASIRALGQEPTVAALMRMVPHLRRSEAEEAIAQGGRS